MIAVDVLTLSGELLLTIDGQEDANLALGPGGGAAGAVAGAAGAVPGADVLLDAAAEAGVGGPGGAGAVRG